MIKGGTKAPLAISLVAPLTMTERYGLDNWTKKKNTKHCAQHFKKGNINININKQL